MPVAVSLQVVHLRIIYIVLLIGASNVVHAQDSLLQKRQAQLDSVFRYNNQLLDSLQKNFHHRTDSVQRTYAAPLRKLDTEIGRLRHKKDSLTKLKLPTKKIKRQLDSLKHLQAKKLRELNSKINKVKTEMIGKVASLKLPPEVQKEVATYTKNIKGFQLPTDFFKLPSVNVPGMPNITNGSLPNMPSANLPALSLPNVNSSLPTNLKLPSTVQLEGVVKNDLQQFESIKKKANAETLEKDLENIAQQNSELKSLAKDEQQLKDLKKKLSGANPKNMDSLALQQLKPAVDHFAGKEKELQSAMGTISKYKQKYSEVKSLSGLPKRRPNPLKGKPWRERLVPGLNYFIMSKHNTLVDLNPYVSWRFTPRLTGAIGWNERMGVSKGQVITHRYDRVFGVRSSLSYRWAHGIIFMIAPEVMDAFVPVSMPDSKKEKLVFGIYAGVRKSFPVYRFLSGYSEVLYNFRQKPGENIYGDPVTFRFGMEVKFKKAKGKDKK